MLIDAFDSLFKGNCSFAPQAFENIEKVIRKIYDSYQPKKSDEPTDQSNLKGLDLLRRITQKYFRQNI